MHFDQPQSSGGRLHSIATLTTGLADGDWQRHCKRCMGHTHQSFWCSQPLTDLCRLSQGHHLQSLKPQSGTGHLRDCQGIWLFDGCQGGNTIDQLEHITQMYLQVTAIADFEFTEIQEGILTKHA